MSNRIEEIKARLNAATKGRWVYDAKRDTQDCCIYVEGSEEKDGCIASHRGGVIGSSEWIWIKDADGEFIAHSKEDIEWLIGEVDRLQEPEPRRGINAENLRDGGDFTGHCCVNGLYIALAANGTVLTSPDGIVWTPRIVIRTADT